MPNRQEKDKKTHEEVKDEVNDIDNEEMKVADDIDELHEDEVSVKREMRDKKKKEESKKDILMLEKKLASREEELEKKESELAAVKDLLLRRQADFDNYKKRIIRTQDEQKKFAIKDLSLDIITINDDLLRAVEAAENVPQDESLREAHDSFVEGVRLISNQIESALKKYGIEEIDSINQEFDPNYNEAVEISTSEDVKKDTITKVYQKGFRLDDYVIRSAKVRVSKPVKSNDKTVSEDADEEKSV
jgi:molecular chaperone GrpE